MLLDLSGVDTSPQSPPSFPSPTDSLHAPETGVSLLDDELMSLGNGVTSDPLYLIFSGHKPVKRRVSSQEV